MEESVGAIIVRRGTILLGKRSSERTSYPHVWDVFGGHIEPLESHEQALRRELNEELGITPIAWRYLETVTEPEKAGWHARPRCHCYVVTQWRGTPTNQQPNEHERIEWFSLSEASQLELAHPAYPRLFALSVEPFGSPRR